MSKFKVIKKNLDDSGVRGMDPRIYLPMHRIQILGFQEDEKLEDRHIVTYPEFLLYCTLAHVCESLSRTKSAYGDLIEGIRNTKPVTPTELQTAGKYICGPEEVVKCLDELTTAKFALATSHSVSLLPVTELPFVIKKMLYRDLRASETGVQLARRITKDEGWDFYIGSDFKFYVKTDVPNLAIRDIRLPEPAEFIYL